METTASEVKVLEGELSLLKPHLQKAAKEAAEMIEKIAADTVIYLKADFKNVIHS